MRSHSIQVDTTVSVDAQEVIRLMEYGDVYDWIGTLSLEEVAEFVEGLPECFEGQSFIDLLGIDVCLEEALNVVSKAYHASPYERGKVKDRLLTDGVRLE